MREANVENQCCPDCGRPLQRVCEHPNNEIWCVHCGNRYYATMASGDRGADDKLSGFRVLMLDADANRRDRIVAHLTRLGYLVTPVCHPRQAMEAASFRRFDLAVLPQTMPEFESSIFVRKLKLLMGSVKCVLVAGRSSTPSPVEDPDVVCIEMDELDCQLIERIVERFVDDIISARASSPHAEKEHSALVGSL